MISLNKACDIAVKFSKQEEKNVISWIVETPSRYIIAIKGSDEEYFSPISVEKSTGKTELYFYPQHPTWYKGGKKIKVPDQYYKAENDDNEQER